MTDAIQTRLVNALNVLTLTPHIRAYLARTDPKALAQAEAARAAIEAAYDRAEAAYRACQDRTERMHEAYLSARDIWEKAEAEELAAYERMCRAEYR